jgi:hypothetical protein
MPEWECKAYFKAGTFGPFEASNQWDAIRITREDFLSDDVFEITDDFQDPTDPNWEIMCREI